MEKKMAGFKLVKGLTRKLGWAALLLLLAACSAANSSESASNPEAAPEVQNSSSPAPTSPVEPDGDSPGETIPVPTPGPAPDLNAVPLVDTGIASVPLQDIVFDTFGSLSARFVPLSNAEEDFIVGLRDAIRPIYQPVYGGPDSLPWLQNDNLVIGYVSGDNAFAYPINILNLHELVNDEIDGKPVLISYCPLCASGVVYSRELDGEVLLFGNTSALYQSDLVMFDHGTGSYWFQVAGEAVVGELTGTRLRLLPSTTMAWSEWKRLHPETRLLTGVAVEPERFQRPRYAQRVFAGYSKRVNDGNFAFPVDETKLDERLDAADLVLTVEVGDAVSAYPLDRIGDGVVNDSVGGMPVVVFSSEDSRSVGAFGRAVDGRTLTFKYNEEDGALIDAETSSIWDASGMAIGGSLQGTQLDPANTRRAYWFSIAIAFPGVNLDTP